LFKLLTIKKFQQFTPEQQNKVIEFIEYLESQPSKTSTGASLLAALPSIGTWQGDDLEDCLQSVYDGRSAAQFIDDEHNPFN
jgi:hypothetical protein